MSYTYKYPRPAMTADSIVFTWNGEKLAVLLIKRKNPPYRGAWAFPGGFMEMSETAEACAFRELKEETGIVAPFLRQVGAFTAVDRDPRGRIVSVAYYTWTDSQEKTVRAGDDAARAAWFALDGLPSLAFDHQEILTVALERFKEDLRKISEGEGKIPIDFSSPKIDRIQIWLRGII